MDAPARPIPLGLKFLILSDFAAIAQDGKLILAGIFDRIFAQSFPARHPRMMITASLKAPLGRHFVGIRLTNPAGQMPTGAMAPVTVDVTEAASSNVLVELRDLPILEAGRFTVQLFVDNQLVGETTFDAVLLPGNPAPKP